MDTRRRIMLLELEQTPHRLVVRYPVLIIKAANIEVLLRSLSFSGIVWVPILVDDLHISIAVLNTLLYTISDSLDKDVFEIVQEVFMSLLIINFGLCNRVHLELAWAFTFIEFLLLKLYISAIFHAVVVYCIVRLEVDHLLDTHEHLNSPMFTRLPLWKVKIKIDLTSPLMHQWMIYMLRI